ncbi:hypothetical protein CDL15_Pgr009552 [Punica granatum]|uniref:Uncharacterized protein n=1 Tax=Punica granatum TaxID=22663 RepID=A0A218WTR6_PUNGR|nr:hypothetical protein CDL15_Pgr009552 [Punica granatum]
MFESSENAQYESKYIHLSANTSGESCAMEDDEGKRIAAIAARTQRECEARNLFAIIFRIELKMLQDSTISCVRNTSCYKIASLELNISEWIGTVYYAIPQYEEHLVACRGGTG